MSAPVLSPAEQDEVTRFGVHDEEILRSIEEHLDDEARCETCEKSVIAWRLEMRCCGIQSLVCAACRASIREYVGATRVRGRLLRCGHCKHIFPPLVTFDEAIAEVQL